jgi:hypothetical protein
LYAINPESGSDFGLRLRNYRFGFWRFDAPSQIKVPAGQPNKTSGLSWKGHPIAVVGQP